jgi:hypothetical protein
MPPECHLDAGMAQARRHSHLLARLPESDMVVPSGGSWTTRPRHIVEISSPTRGAVGSVIPSSGTFIQRLLGQTDWRNVRLQWNTALAQRRHSRYL